MTSSVKIVTWGSKEHYELSQYPSYVNHEGDPVVTTLYLQGKTLEYTFNPATVHLSDALEWP